MIKKIKLQAILDNYQKFMDFLQKQTDRSRVNSDIVSDIMIAGEEVVVNVMHYAYPDKKGDLEVSFERKEDLVRIIFADSGKPFNPFEKQEPDINKPVEDREIGGLGILLVKKLMDGADYEYRENKNVLTIVKKIS